MRFCNVCDNMLYLQLDDSNKLTYHCKNCLLEVKAGDDDARTCVLGRNYVDDETSYKQFVNRHIRHDPTLPRVNNIPCVNPDCNKPVDVPDEVIFAKYDPVNMRFLYYCNHCETFWKSKM